MEVLNKLCFQALAEANSNPLSKNTVSCQDLGNPTHNFLKAMRSHAVKHNERKEVKKREKSIKTTAERVPQSLHVLELSEADDE